MWVLLFCNYLSLPYAFQWEWVGSLTLCFFHTLVGTVLWESHSVVQGTVGKHPIAWLPVQYQMLLVALSVVTKCLDAISCRKPGRFCIRSLQVCFPPGSHGARQLEPFSHLEASSTQVKLHAHQWTPNSPGSEMLYSISGPCFKPIRKRSRCFLYLLPFDFHWHTLSLTKLVTFLCALFLTRPHP